MLADQSSKSVHLLALRNLPCTKETAELTLVRTMVYRSMWCQIGGPQFSSHFWRVFCNLLGASVSLSSGVFIPASQLLKTVLQCLTSSGPKCLEPLTTLGGVLHKFPAILLHRAFSIPVLLHPRRRRQGSNLWPDSFNAADTPGMSTGGVCREAGTVSTTR